MANKMTNDVIILVKADSKVIDYPALLKVLYKNYNETVY